MKSVRIRSYSDPHFPAFGLVYLRIQSNCGKMRARITPNTDTFHAVKLKIKVMSQWKLSEILLALAVTYMTTILRNIFNTENAMKLIKVLQSSTKIKKTTIKSPVLLKKTTFTV